jgi:hypothetical protein
LKIAGIMTDNGSCYRAKAFAKLCRRLRLKHISTKPYRPQTNGKPSASSRRLCASGPMTPQTSVPKTCRSGFITITGIARTAAWNPDLPSAASVSGGDDLLRLHT